MSFVCPMSDVRCPMSFKTPTAFAAKANHPARPIPKDIGHRTSDKGHLLSERFPPARDPGCCDGTDLIFNQIAASAFEGLPQFADLAARAI